MEKIIHECNCQLKLDGGNEVPADVLCGVLSNILVVAEKTKSNEVENIKYMVKATAKGSFLIDLAVIAESVLPPLVANGADVINMANNSLQTLSELLKLKTFLKGEKPQKVEEKQGCLKVTNNTGTINVFNLSGDLINNPQVDKALTKIGDALSNGNIPSMIITDTDNEENVVEVSKEDYQYIQHPMAEVDKDRIYENTSDVEFIAKKPDLQGNSQWEIILDERCVRASIEDEAWLEKVKSGVISVNSKQILKAKMRVTIKGDKYNIPIQGSEKYYILEVYSNDEAVKYPQIEIQ